MATIRPSALPPAASVANTAAVPIDTGSAVEKSTPKQLVDAGVPLASQEAAETGASNDDRMSSLRVKQAIDVLGVSAANLASSDADKGAALVGLPQGGKVSDALKYITPEMYGAVADGATDDLSAINAAVAAVASIPGTYLLFNRASYAASDTVDLTIAKVVYSDGAVIVPLHDGVAVQMVSAPSTPLTGCRISGDLEVAWPSADWTKDRVGFYFQNIYSGEFYLSCRRATRSLVLHGNGTGCVYNRFYFREMMAHNVGIWLSSETSSGWANANEFHGGRFYGAGSVAGSLYESIAGHIYFDDTLYRNNGNRFIDNSIEWVGAGFRLARMGGLRNRLSPKYCELGSGDTTWITDDGIENTIDVDNVPYMTGYDPDTSGSAQRLDASAATRPIILGPQGYKRMQSFTQNYYTTSTTVPAVRGVNTTTGPAVTGRNLNSPANPAIGAEHTDGTLGVGIPASGVWLVKRNTTGTIDRRHDWNSGVNTPPTAGAWKVGDTSRRNAASQASPVIEDVCISAGTPGSWRAAKWIVGIGATGSRPSLLSTDIGVQYLDTTLAAAGKPIWWTGAAWVDADGSAA